MTALIIIGIILAIILIVLFMPISVFVKNDDTLGVYFCVQVLFLKFDNTPKKQKNNKRKSKRNDKNGENTKDDKPNPFLVLLKKLTGTETVTSAKSFKKMAKKKGTITTVLDALKSFKTIFSKLYGLLKKFTVKKVFLKVNISSDDAAQTAIDYGIACSAIYPVFGYIDSLIEIKNRELEVNCDYDAKKCSAEFEVQISFRVSSILSAFIKIINDNVARKVIRSVKN